MNESFWNKLDLLVNTSELCIDRPKGSSHPKYPALIYPCDYGYLKGTSGSDGNEIDVWRGSLQKKKLTALLCTVDILKKDCEVKLLLGCASKEEKIIMSFLNDSDYLSAILIKRNK
jgi:inorganic pyrophosphatase